MGRTVQRFVLFVVVGLCPSFLYAQGSITGIVKDNTGAVLPGVTVEASSPSLIEKVRAAVTDGSGQYRITELTPGTYTLTFSLTGFSTVKREAISVSGSGVITINADLKVGAVEETITASGGRANEGRMMIDGLNVAASFNGGGVSTFIYDIANAAEMQVSVSGALGEAENGGPQLNLVPKTGGNKYEGSFFYSSAGKWSTGNNLDGSCPTCTAPAGIIKAWDISGSGGGPIKKDKVWFFVNARKYSNVSPNQGVAANLYQGDATKWIWAKDPNVEARSADSRSIQSIRLTSQLTARNRISFYDEHQHRCSGSTITPTGEGCRVRDADWIGHGATNTSPETFPGYHDLPYYVTQATWSSPVSSRL